MTHVVITIEIETDISLLVQQLNVQCLTVFIVYFN